MFDALAEATEEAARVRGGMYWHAGPASSPESRYLVRTTPAGAETRPRPPQARRDVLQADAVQVLLAQYLPQA